MSINYSDPAVQFVFGFQRRATYDRISSHLSHPASQAVADAMQAVMAGNPQGLINVPASLYDHVPVVVAGGAHAGDIVAWYEEVLGDLA